MPKAAFEDEPQAAAAAIALRELGFNAEITTAANDDSYDERARALLAGKPPSFKIHSWLESTDADLDGFIRIVQRHHGLPLSS
jgi:hypothetical protein